MDRKEFAIVKNAITLIGMPGSGKSTVGRLLAEKLGLPHIDTDLLMESLPELISTLGMDGFLDHEASVVMGLQASAVVSTGGSVVYRDRAMQHLRGLGRVVFLNVEEGELVQRAGDLVARGVAMRPGQSYGELMAERVPLYLRYCDVVVDGNGLPEEVVGRVVELLRCRLIPARGLFHG